MASLSKATVVGIAAILLLWGGPLRAQDTAVAGAGAPVEDCSQVPSADAAPRPPSVWQEQEKGGMYHGTWRFAGSDGIGRYGNGVVVKLKITKYDGHTVELDRIDPDGITAKFRGSIDGNHVTGTADFKIANINYPNIDWFATFETTNPTETLQQSHEAERKGDWHEVLADLRDAEAADSAEAYDRMGHYYEAVSNPPDYVTALRCYQKAEALGDATGTLAVGRFYQEGFGGLDDLGKADRLHEAEQRYLAVARTDNQLGIEYLTVLEILQRREPPGPGDPPEWKTLTFQAADGRTRVRAKYASERRDSLVTTMVVSCTMTGVRPARSIDMWFLAERDAGGNPQVSTFEYRRQDAPDSVQIRPDGHQLLSNQVLVARASIVEMIRAHHQMVLTADALLQTLLGNFMRGGELTDLLGAKYQSILAEAREGYLTIFSPAGTDIEYSTSANERHNASFNFQQISADREAFLRDCQMYDPFKPVTP